MGYSEFETVDGGFFSQDGEHLAGAFTVTVDARPYDTGSQYDDRIIAVDHTARDGYRCRLPLPLGSGGSLEEYDIFGPDGEQPQSYAEARTLGRLAARLAPHNQL